MDFLGRIFGISPDNGSGLIEVAIMVALFAAVCLRFGLKIVRTPPPPRRGVE